MLARLSLFALCAALAGTPVLAQEFDCSGVFGPESSADLLIQTYGADNVVTGNVPGAEGMDMLATTVFPNDPDKKLVFGWWDEEGLKELSYVDLPPSMSGPHGVRTGMSVDEVVAINGAPFTIGGFWWDYGGYATIDTGKLANIGDGCYVWMRFSPAEDYPASTDVTEIAGDRQIPTTEPLLKTVDTRLAVLSVGYPGPEGAD
jgi:hypothetical protein